MSLLNLSSGSCLLSSWLEYVGIRRGLHQGIREGLRQDFVMEIKQDLHHLNQDKDIRKMKYHFYGIMEADRILKILVS